MADALAPGLLVAQAIGRLGNWFNQELYGRPTDAALGAAHRRRRTGPPGYPRRGTLYHPTFLYEMIWNLGVAGLLIWLDRRFQLGHGRVFLLYVVVYTSGRLWIEMLRIDPAHEFLGLRINVWTSIIVGLGGAGSVRRWSGAGTQDVTRPSCWHPPPCRTTRRSRPIPPADPRASGHPAPHTMRRSIRPRCIVTMTGPTTSPFPLVRAIPRTRVGDREDGA